MGIKMNITIRKYEKKDYEDAKKICLGTGAGPLGQFPDFTVTTFLDYYVEIEPENCFLATNEQGVVVGYVLCSENTKEWAEKFKNEFVSRIAIPPLKEVAIGTSMTLLPFADDYQAHLHIDLLEEAQGKGVGRKLMETLYEHLRKKNVKGIILNVAVDNTGAQEFYKKLGYSVLQTNENEIVMGIKL